MPFEYKQYIALNSFQQFYEFRFNWKPKYAKMTLIRARSEHFTQAGYYTNALYL